MALRSGAILICAGIALALGAFGCSAGGAGDDDSAAGDESHFTVSSGHKFIVTATPEHVVFRKEVSGTAFPFDVDSLKDKAILIHPISGKAEDGVYSRVKSVEDDGSTYIVEATPLSFTEMEAITEDEIVRVYLDPKHSSNTATAGATADPQSFGQLFVTPNDFDFGSAMNVRPQGLISGIPFGSFGTDAALDTSASKSPGVVFKQTVEQASFKPGVLFNWSKETGLELGFRTEFDWKSKVNLKGNLTGEFYRSNPYEAFGAWVWVPMGIVAIPIKAGIRLQIRCKATVVFPAELDLDVEAHAKIGGSVRVKASSDTPMSDWVSKGSWPGEATGSAKVVPTSLDFAPPDGTIWCSFPRIELHTEVFGVVGPVAVISPTAVLDKDGFHPELRFSAGVTASFFGIGKEAGLEVPVYTAKF